MPNASQAQFPYHHRPASMHTVAGRDAGERVGHPDLARRQVQDERVLGMQPLPAGHDLDLSCPAFSGQGIAVNSRGFLPFQVLVQGFLRSPVAES